MYEQIYNLTCMFFKSLKGNLMYEFLISKFNGKRGSKRQLSLEQIVALNIYMNKGDRPLDYSEQ